MNNNILIIAEAGVNHNGSLETAFELVDKAIAAGVDIVKFQTFVTENMVTSSAKQAKYQTVNIGEEQTQFDMLKQLELTFEEHKKLQAYCISHGIEYLSTAFDVESLALLADEMDLPRLKIPSGELTNGPFILAHAQKRKPLIVSTGMANLTEIRQALVVIAYGLVKGEQANLTGLSILEMERVFNSDEGQNALAQYVTLLHCTTEYPAPIESINLAAMSVMSETFHLPVGYSDHSEGIDVSVISAAQGACVIEKHFTLDKEMKGPDHKASIEPNELAALVSSVRKVEAVVGEKIKEATECELKNIAVARKSLVASEDILPGADFSVQNIAIMRPGSGISPMEYWDYLGRKSKKHYIKGELIER